VIVLLVGFNFPRHLAVANTTITSFCITGLRDCASLCTPWFLASEAVELMPFQRYFFLGVLLMDECFEVASKYQDWFFLTGDSDQAFRYPTKTGCLINTELFDNLVDSGAQMSGNNLGVESSHF